MIGKILLIWRLALRGIEHRPAQALLLRSSNPSSA
jgi:hypothetical protein